jgi:hypothetical protein
VWRERRNHESLLSQKSIVYSLLLLNGLLTTDGFLATTQRTHKGHHRHVHDAKEEHY